MSSRRSNRKQLKLRPPEPLKVRLLRLAVLLAMVPGMIAIVWFSARYSGVE